MNDDIRAANAQQILDNPEWRAAFQDTRHAIFRQIESADITDSAMRDKLMLSAQLLKRIRSVLEDRVNTGKLNKDQLKKKNILNRSGM